MTTTTPDLSWAIDKLRGYARVATAAGRADDARALEIAVGALDDLAVRAIPAAERQEHGRFIPQGEPVEGRGAPADCCPWTHEGVCPQCRIRRDTPFSAAKHPGKVFICLTYWGYRRF